jgi:hypothetical protein
MCWLDAVESICAAVWRHRRWAGVKSDLESKVSIGAGVSDEISFPKSQTSRRTGAMCAASGSSLESDAFPKSSGHASVGSVNVGPSGAPESGGVCVGVGVNRRLRAGGRSCVQASRSLLISMFWSGSRCAPASEMSACVRIRVLNDSQDAHEPTWGQCAPVSSS